MNIKVIVAGASGKMGQEVIKMLQQQDHLELVCGVSRTHQGKDVGESMGLGKFDVPMVATVLNAVEQFPADVLVDFTTPKTVKKHALIALENGVRPVIGTSGLNEEEIQEIAVEAEKRELGMIVAPNFAIGGVLMMQFAAQAAKYLPHVEIIESHHDQKLDAPSGTAMKTAEGIRDQRRLKVTQGHTDEEELLSGARGAYYNGFRIHSIRLPGLVAHQEVLFGGSGQLLTIRHDSFNRESFMPGVQLAIEKVVQLQKCVYGLEKILDF